MPDLVRHDNKSAICTNNVFFVDCERCQGAPLRNLKNCFGYKPEFIVADSRRQNKCWFAYRPSVFPSHVALSIRRKTRYSAHRKTLRGQRSEFLTGEYTPNEGELQPIVTEMDQVFFCDLFTILEHSDVL
jgi:hypothetical protein